MSNPARGGDIHPYKGGAEAFWAGSNVWVEPTKISGARSNYWGGANLPEPSRAKPAGQKGPTRSIGAGPDLFGAEPSPTCEPMETRFSNWPASSYATPSSLATPPTGMLIHLKRSGLWLPCADALAPVAQEKGAEPEGKSFPETYTRAH